MTNDNRTTSDPMDMRITRRTVCAGLVVALAMPFIARAQNGRMVELILYGPPAGPSITLAYAVGAGLLRNVADKVSFKVWRTPDEMRAGLTSGTMQALVMPVTTAANLHTRGLGVKLANVMTNGLLYVISTDASIKTFADLKGRRITVPFPNDTPELIFDALLDHHGLVGGKDVEVEVAGSPIEAVQMLLSGRIETALVPEPGATAAIIRAAASGKEIHRVLDIQAEWGNVTGLGPVMPQAGLALSQSLLDEHPDAVEPLLKGLEEAAAAVVARPSEAAGHAAAALELPWPVIEKSIPFSNLVAIRAAAGRSSLEALFQTIVRTNPKMIGGRMPDETLYL